MQKLIWSLVIFLATMPYVLALLTYPYVRSAGLASAIAFMIFFLPPALIFGAILTYVLKEEGEPMNPKGLVRFLFIANLIFYLMVFYQLFLQL